DIFATHHLENIDSCIYSGPKVKLAGDALQTGKEDEQLGYKCAVLVLGEYFDSSLFYQNTGMVSPHGCSHVID
ncbi:MAG: hypothetical protein AAFY76_21860, partial [Cyanobacteria bacterium J06649_11]